MIKLIETLYLRERPRSTAKPFTLIFPSLMYHEEKMRLWLEKAFIISTAAEDQYLALLDVRYIEINANLFVLVIGEIFLNENF